MSWARRRPASRVFESGAPQARLRPCAPSPHELSIPSRSMLRSGWVEPQIKAWAPDCAGSKGEVPAGASGSRTPSISKRLRREEAVKDKQVCSTSPHLLLAGPSTE